MVREFCGAKVASFAYRSRQPFAEREALGQYWMKDLDQGAFRGETYVAHISENLFHVLQLPA